MRHKKSYQWIAAGFMLAVSAANIYGSEVLYQGLKNNSQGAEVDLSSYNSKAYGVDGLWKQKDGNYVVQAAAEGFGGPIVVSVEMDELGGQIVSVSILSQQETENLGSKVEDEEFLKQFKGIDAPVKVADMIVASPISGSVAEPLEDSAAEQEVVFDSAAWNPEDQSPEAQTIRTLYDAGLLQSAIGQKELTTVLADSGAETQTLRKLYDAGLLQSSSEGTVLAAALADGTPEQRAEKRLQETGLVLTPETDLSEVSQAVAVEAAAIDGIAGATISSKAVAMAVDQAYFFVNECVINQ